MGNVGKYMEAGSPQYKEAVDVINGMIGVINRSGNRKPGAILYVGHRQYHALKTIEKGDPQEVNNEEFLGWPIVRVMKESWCRLSV